MLSCHCCQEVITDGDDQTYHDGQYRLICQLCRPDCLEVKALDTILANNDVDTITAPTENYTKVYATAYRSFLIQKAAMEAFFAATQNLSWTLPVSHSGYYQSEFKAISLIQEQFDHIKTLMQHHRQPQDYPVYTFTPPGRIVNSYRDNKDTTSNKVLIKVVVSDRFWDRVVNNPLAHNLPWIELSRNSNCDLTIFQRYPELPWDIQGLCLNPNLTLAWIQAYPQLAWDWRDLSRNPNLTQSWLEAFPNKPWVAFWLTVNPNFHISWVEIVTHPETYWSWWDISRHPNLTPEWLRRHPRARWNYREISNKVSTDFFAEHLAENWDLARIVARPEFSLEFINNLVEQRMSLLASDGGNVSNITNNDLRTLCDMIVSHPQLDLTWLQRFSHLDLYWYGLNCHKNFNWSWCQALPDKPWDWQQVASLLVLD